MLKPRYWIPFLLGFFVGTYLLAGEREEVDRLAAKWRFPPNAVEVQMPDGTRADLLGKHHIWEVDYARKWAEAIGQSLHYADQTKMSGKPKKPGVILLLRDPKKDWRNLVRGAYQCGKLGIALRVEEVEGD